MIVLWRVTEACNLSCGFCAYDRRIKRARKTADPHEVKRGLALLSDFAEQRGEPIHISWLGGEPLLWRPLFDLTTLHAKRGRLRFSATTNGRTLHQPSVRDCLMAHLSELTLSVDALAQTHDALRGNPGLWTQLADAVSKLARARNAASLKLRVNTVLMRSTLPQFYELCHALADWGIDEITFNALGGRDRPEFFPAERLRPEDWATFCGTLPSLRASLASKGVALAGTPSYLDRIGASALNISRPIADCAPGEDHLFIDCDGLISPCHHTGADYGLSLSSVHTVDDLIALPVQFRAARKISPSAHCSDCLSTRVFGKFAA